MCIMMKRILGDFLRCWTGCCNCLILSSGKESDFGQIFAFFCCWSILRDDLSLYRMV
jgi:hypothetical protein